MVRLRPLDIGDAEAQVAGEDDAMTRWLSGGRSTLAGQRQSLRRTRAAWDQGEPAFDLGIEHVGSGALVGTLGLDARLEVLRSGEVNVSYGLYPPWRGRGLASRALTLGIRLAIDRFCPSLLVIRVDPANLASIAVATRAGFARSHHTVDAHGALDWYVRTPVPA